MYVIPHGAIIEFDYTNNRGEKEKRKVKFNYLQHGKNEYYPEWQFFIHCFCLDRMATRSFALNQIEQNSIVMYNS